MLTNVLNICGLFDSVKVAADLFDAAPSWPDNAIVSLEVLYEELFGGSSIDFISTVGHGLAAASLIEWVTYIQPKSL